MSCIMAIVKMIIKKDDKPTDEQLRSLEEAKKQSISFDEDSPGMTEDMLKNFRRVFPKDSVLDVK